jgi:hypothetical protein
MRLSRKWFIHWVGMPRYRGDRFVWGVTRFNGGGYMYGAAPYTYWRVGPVMVKRYM